MSDRLFGGGDEGGMNSSSGGNNNNIFSFIRNVVENASQGGVPSMQMNSMQSPSQHQQQQRQQQRQSQVQIELLDSDNEEEVEQEDIQQQRIELLDPDDEADAEGEGQQQSQVTVELLNDEQNAQDQSIAQETLQQGNEQQIQRHPRGSNDSSGNGASISFSTVTMIGSTTTTTTHNQQEGIGNVFSSLGRSSSNNDSNNAFQFNGSNIDNNNINGWFFSVGGDGGVQQGDATQIPPDILNFIRQATESASQAAAEAVRATHAEGFNDNDNSNSNNNSDDQDAGNNSSDHNNVDNNGRDTESNEINNTDNNDDISNNARSNNNSAQENGDEQNELGTQADIQVEILGENPADQDDEVEVIEIDINEAGDATVRQQQEGQHQQHAQHERHARSVAEAAAQAAGQAAAAAFAAAAQQSGFASGQNTNTHTYTNFGPQGFRHSFGQGFGQGADAGASPAAAFAAAAQQAGMAAARAAAEAAGAASATGTGEHANPGAGFPNFFSFPSAANTGTETNANTFSFQFQHAFDPRTVPPASTEAMRKLPVILVQPEDLIDPNNRECCICLDEIHLQERVLRMPCAHIFHKNCIVDWLKNHSCTCPTCRYELPTDDPRYEFQRKERMKLRKPRFAQFELQRMSVEELASLIKERTPTSNCPQNSQYNNIDELLASFDNKDTYVEYIMSNSLVDIVEMPPPTAQYKLSDLKKLKISQLREKMNEAGVFFNPQDVVEKQDMLHIFTNSGRLMVLPEQEGNEEKEVESETDKSNSDSQNDAMNDCSDNDRKSDWQCSNEDEKPVSQVSGSSNSSNNRKRQRPECKNKSFYETDSIDHQYDEQYNITDGAVTELVPSFSYNDKDDNADVDSANDNQQQEANHHCNDNHSLFDSLTISELNSFARRMQIDISDCIEKKEIVNRLFPNENYRDGQFTQLIDDFSVSELKTLASLINMDLAQCDSREQMIQHLVASNDKNRGKVDTEDDEDDAHRAFTSLFRSYCLLLGSLRTLKISQLYGLAKDWGNISIQDCIEKCEIIYKLISHVQKGWQRS